MTAQKLLDNALALILTSSVITPEYSACAVPLINQMLAEITPYDNIIRAERGLPRQAGMLILSLGDELPCQDRLASAALPYGLAAKLLIDDDELAKAAFFHNQYISACEMAAGWQAGPVKDCYAGGAI